MSVEMPSPAFVPMEAVGLADIVEEGGQTESFLRRDSADTFQTVTVYIVNMAGIVLYKAYAGLQLRQDHGDHIGEFL
jgi:hypothetical protein